MENLREQDEDEGVDVIDDRLQGETAAGGEEEEDAEEDVEDEEEETATEVEVSEKTLKFKISTESGRKSYPGSRKGSRDKSSGSGSSDLQHQELARAVRDLHHHQHHHHHHHHHGGGSSAAPARSSLATSPQSGRSVEFSRCNGDKENKCLSFEDDTLSRSSPSPCRARSPPLDTSPTSPSMSPLGPSPPGDLASTATAAAQGAPAASPTKMRSPSSLLKKLKNLTDRLSFSVSGDGGGGNSSRDQASPVQPSSPCHHGNCRPASASPAGCHGAAACPNTCPATCPASPQLPQGDRGDRAERATLPKTRGPRGWRSLLGADPHPQRADAASAAAMGAQLDDSRDRAASEGALAGSGEHAELAEQTEPTGNNNNRRKGGATLWSPGSRRGPRGAGLLSRLKQSGDSLCGAAGSAAEALALSGTGGGAGCAASGGGSETTSAAGRQTGLMASLAASLRPKKSCPVASPGPPAGPAPSSSAP